MKAKIAISGLLMLMGLLLAGSAKATCWGCPQTLTCTVREAGLNGLTQCMSGAGYCDLSGETCTGTSGPPCKPACNRDKITTSVASDDWRVVRVTVRGAILVEAAPKVVEK